MSLVDSWMISGLVLHALNLWLKTRRPTSYLPHRLRKPQSRQASDPDTSPINRPHHRATSPAGGFQVAPKPQKITGHLSTMPPASSRRRTERPLLLPMLLRVRQLKASTRSELVVRASSSKSASEDKPSHALRNLIWYNKSLIYRVSISSMQT